ncbi:MAG: SDR family NAD(P)-dependent oxidoreductase [Dehalococcoidia bacterium]
MDIQNAVTVITGGGSGIGRALALAMAREGADLVIADLNEKGALQAAEEVRGLGRRALGLRVDISKEAGVTALVTRAVQEFGRIDIFVSNAGVLLSGPLEKVTDADWRWIMDVNFYAHVYAVRHVLPRMLERGRGYLVHVASAAALVQTGTNIPYHVSKSAVLALVEGLAIDLKARGSRVGVSCVCPEIVSTNLPERSFEAGQTGRNLNDEERAAHVETAEAMKLRMAQRGLPPAEAARAIVAGIKEDRFLIYTHERTHDIVLHRMQDPAEGLDDAVRVLQREQERMQQYTELVRRSRT